MKKNLICGDIPTARSAYGRSLNMAWPSALEAVFVSLISSVDTMMVGGLGSAAISAVGICTQPKFILLAAIMTLNVGVTAVVARRKGEGDTAGAVRTLKQSLFVCFCIAFVLNLLGEIFAPQLLTLAGAQPDYIDTAVTYFRIMLIGNFFSSLSLTMTAAQRGYGNTRISMITNCTANLVNVLMNAMLINGLLFFPKLGVMGAAIATAIGNFIAFLIALISVVRTDVRLSISNNISWRPTKKDMASVSKVWSSAFVEQIFIRIGFFLYAGMVARLGTVLYATHQICMQIINMTFSVGDGLGIATTSLVGQSLGEKRPDLAFVYARIGQNIALVMGVLLAIILVTLRTPLLSLFTNEKAVIQEGQVIMLIVAITSLTQPPQVVTVGTLRGAGDNKFVALSSLVCIGIIRPFLSWVLCYPLGLGLVGAWVGLYIDQISRAIFYMCRFFSAKWTKVKL